MSKATHNTSVSLLSLIDNHHRLLKLLKEQQDTAKALYSEASQSGIYRNGVLLQLETISTSAERMVTEQGWLRNSVMRADQKLEEIIEQETRAEVDAEIEQELHRQEQLLLDSWYMFDPS